jgi:hypothetical protein
MGASGAETFVKPVTCHISVIFCALFFWLLRKHFVPELLQLNADFVAKRGKKEVPISH